MRAGVARRRPGPRVSMLACLRGSRLEPSTELNSSASGKPEDHRPTSGIIVGGNNKLQPTGTASYMYRQTRVISNATRGTAAGHCSPADRCSPREGAT